MRIQRAASVLGVLHELHEGLLLLLDDLRVAHQLVKPRFARPRYDHRQQARRLPGPGILAGDIGLGRFAAWVSAAPVRINLATRNCPPGTSFQPDGTSQFGLAWPEAAPGPACPIMLPASIGGCEAGNCAWAVGAGKLTDLRNSTKAGFCCATSASSPVILKNQATPSRRVIAARMTVFSPEPGFAPACS